MISFLLPILAYIPSLFTFFSGDDWAHMRVSQIVNSQEFLNFFSFTHNAQSLTFYRPLPQQVFFFIFNRLFGLHAFPYHVFVLVCFAVSLYLLYRLAKKLNLTDTQAKISVLICGLAAANFPRLYFLSAFQDILLPLFVLASLVLFLDKKYLWSVVFFVLGLMSKETAVVVPMLLFGLIFLTRTKQHKYLVPFILIDIVYLFFRFKYFGGAAGDSYIYDFSLKKALNTLFWYVIWTLGAPENLVDYVSSGFKILPRFFTDFSLWSKIILFDLAALFLTLGYYLVNVRKQVSQHSRFILFCLFFFLVSLAPVIFMPWHKFTHSLSLPMVGSSLLLGFLFSSRKPAAKLFLAAYLLTNLTMMVFLYNRHYTINRSRISEKVYHYFSQNYPQAPSGSYFVFTNNSSQPNQSKELSLALSQSDFFKVYFHDRNYAVYYQDLGLSATPSGQPIFLDSGQFLIR